MRIKNVMKWALFAGIAGAAALLGGYAVQPLRKGVGADSSIRYELVEDWPDLSGQVTLGNPTGLGIDTSQNLVVFHRASRTWPMSGKMPVDSMREKTILVIDARSGRLIKSWGEDLFIMPHGLTVDTANHVWVTDVGRHQVFKFDYQGNRLMTLGEAMVPGQDSLHFNRPTDVAIGRDGAVYVSDGYRTSRIVKFTASGKYLLEWGTRGKGDGQFVIPHAISISRTGEVYVADRENARIQVFDSNGKFLRKFSAANYGVMCAVVADDRSGKIFAVDDLSFMNRKHRGSDVFVFNPEGVVQQRFGRSGSYPASSAWYHDVAVDRDENIYVGDILRNRVQKFRKVGATGR